MTKTCYKCTKTLSVDNFHKQKRSKDGLVGWCKLCAQEYKAARRALCKDKEYNTNYHKTHRHEHMMRQQHYKQNSTSKFIISKAKHRALRTGLEFSITESDIVIPNVCPVFGVPLAFGAVRGEPMNYSPSIDRIDSSKGYIKGNVWVISTRANRLKSDATLNELELLVGALRSKLLESE